MSGREAAAERLGHDATTARSETLSAYVLACTCGWQASTISIPADEIEFRAHIDAALADQETEL